MQRPSICMHLTLAQAFPAVSTLVAGWLMVKIASAKGVVKVRQADHGDEWTGSRASTLEIVPVEATEKAPLCGAFAEPSSGLEPETPSLPWNDSGNRSQATATVFACWRGFRAGAICDRLPPVATTGLHKGSILCCSCWLHGARRAGRSKDQRRPSRSSSTFGGGASVSVWCRRLFDSTDRSRVVRVPEDQRGRSAEVHPTDMESS